MLKFGCICCTYLRPNLLRSAIESFLRQDYPERELVILDDAGQYPAELSGPGWRLRSVPDRYPTMGDKRNASAAMLSDDVDVIVPWDDDDIHLPWHLSVHAAALQHAGWSAPSRVYCEVGRFEPLEPRYTTPGGAFHSAWAFRRSLFDEVGGYPAINSGQDTALAELMRPLVDRVADTAAVCIPSFVAGWTAETYHLSGLDGPDYPGLAGQPDGLVGTIEPGWGRDYVADAVHLYHAAILGDPA